MVGLSAVESRSDDASGPATYARVRLADQLAHLQLYAVPSPLERLFARPERAVKVALLAAMQQLFFKRSDRYAALEGLKRSRGARFIELARSAIHATTPEVQGAFRNVLRSRGVAA